MSVEEYLASIDKTMEEYDLEHFLAFLKAVKFAYKIPSIEITGSNGKSTTAAFLSNIYSKSGLKVASFIKPASHPLEGICVNKTPIQEETFLEIVSKHQKEITNYQLTAFEVEVYVAFEWFKSEAVDIAIIEAGMGGEMDATNIYDPILSIITSVSLEHTAFLGRTLSEIALAKSGIMRELTPVLVGKLPEEADDIIINKAHELNAPYYRSDDYHNEILTLEGASFDYRPYKDLRIPIPNVGALKDAAIALEAIKILSNRYKVSEENIKEGLLEGGLENRFEVKDRIIYDGAHNVEAMKDLAASLASLNKPYHVLFAAFKDKNIAAMLPIIALDAKSVTLTTFSHPRAKDELDYFLFSADYPFKEEARGALKDLLETYPEDYIVVTGSLAFISYLKEAL